MSSRASGKHAGSGGRVTSRRWPNLPLPSERALWCIWAESAASRHFHVSSQGFPFGSVMPYGLDDHANPIFLISTMAMHTQNMQADPRSSLLVTQPDAIGDPLGASRVTLIGNVLPVPEPEGPKHGHSIWRVMPTANTGWTLTTFRFTGWTWWTFTTWAASG